MFWGYDPRPKTFASSGWYCGYCVKVYNSKRLKYKNIGDYESRLGESNSEAMTEHAATTEGVESQIIKNDCNFKKSINFTLIAQTVNEIVEQQRLDIEAPGWQHAEFTFYLKTFSPDGVSIAPGHVRETWRGVDGVWMLDDPITKVKMTESMQANLRNTYLPQRVAPPKSNTRMPCRPCYANVG